MKDLRKHFKEVDLTTSYVQFSDVVKTGDIIYDEQSKQTRVVIESISKQDLEKECIEKEIYNLLFNSSGFVLLREDKI